MVDHTHTLPVCKMSTWQILSVSLEKCTGTLMTKIAHCMRKALHLPRGPLYFSGSASGKHSVIMVSKNGSITHIGARMWHGGHLMVPSAAGDTVHG